MGVLSGLIVFGCLAANYGVRRAQAIAVRSDRLCSTGVTRAGYGSTEASGAESGVSAEFTPRNHSAKRAFRFPLRGCDVSEAIRLHCFTAAFQSAKAGSARPFRAHW